MWDGLGMLLVLSGLMALASFLAGSLPLSFSLSPRQIRLISAIGTGLLIGTALIVIIPEGIETLYSSSTVSVLHAAHVAPTVHAPMDNDRAALALHNIPKPDKNAAGQGIKHDNKMVKGTDRFLPGEKEPDPPKDSEPKSSQTRRDDHENPTPHAWIGISMISGFILMYLVDIVPAIKSSSSASANGHSDHVPLSTIDPESATSSRQTKAHPPPSRPNPTTVGLLIHALADGIALGASSTNGPTSARGSLSIVVFIAILVHKAPAAFGLTSILLNEGISKRSTRGHLLVFSFAAPLGALVTWMIINILGKADNGPSEDMKWWTGIALMFSGGTFLYVALHAMQTISSSSSHGGHPHVKVAVTDGGDEWETPYVETDGHTVQASQVQEKTRGEVGLVVAGMLLPMLTQMGHSITMKGLLAAMPGFANLVQAATQEVFMINPLGTQAPLVASIVGASPAATTYAMACGPNFPSILSSLPSSLICPDLASVTITQGPATIAYTTVENWANKPTDSSINIRKALHCNLAGTTAAICTNSFDGLDKIVLSTQGLNASQISMGQASLDALKVPETFTLTGKDFPVFGNVVVTAGAEKLQVSGASAAVSASTNAAGKLEASMTMAYTSSGVIGNPGINSISAASNPVVGDGDGLVAIGVAETSSGAVAPATVAGIAESSNTSTAKQAAATESKSSAAGSSVESGCSIIIGALAVFLLL
ncbi:hypothetical protein FKW77_001874 [Venturia effusa]|uniref:Zinc/iron permease n=1 Tax=Venturia effusa TaxID=50376 RepID=A0A517LGL6_9PEZI|nr:hypothetical protein FKW77_001874 [Venturia effusa]